LPNSTVTGGQKPLSGAESSPEIVDGANGYPYNTVRLAVGAILPPLFFEKSLFKNGSN
jgi:hypothetical protein